MIEFFTARCGAGHRAIVRCFALRRRARAWGRGTCGFFRRRRTTWLTPPTEEALAGNCLCASQIQKS